MEAMSLRCVDLQKHYGDQQVLKKVTITCDPGKISGIIGRNGAGKTVLFKAICGLINIDGGDVWFGEYRKKNGEILKSVGAIIEEPAFIANVSGLKNLEYLYMINNKLDRAYLRIVMRKVGLDPDSRKPVRKYSMGMRQRLALAQAIMEDPGIVILDEPFNGLDNAGVSEMRELLLDLKKKGKVILVASHNSEDIRILCDRVFEMDTGVLQEFNY